MDRRRFLQTTAAATTGAAVWSAPRVASAGGVVAVPSDAPCSDGRVIFSDDFDQECTAPSGGYCGNYADFVNWDVTSGGVDVIVGNQHGGCGPDASTGRSLDMSGTGASSNGLLVKKGGVDVVAGRSYLVTFQLGQNGSSGNPPQRIRVTMGGSVAEYPAPTVCDVRSLVHVPSTSGNVMLTFQDVGANDNRGAVLDDVVVREYCDPDGAGRENPLAT